MRWQEWVNVIERISFSCTQLTAAAAAYCILKLGSVEELTRFPLSFVSFKYTIVGWKSYGTLSAGLTLPADTHWLEIWFIFVAFNTLIGWPLAWNFFVHTRNKNWEADEQTGSVHIQRTLRYYTKSKCGHIKAFGRTTEHVMCEWIWLRHFNG